MVSFDVGRIWGGLLKKNGRQMEKFSIFWAEPMSGIGTHCVEEKCYWYHLKWYRYPLTEED